MVTNICCKMYSNCICYNSFSFKLLLSKLNDCKINIKLLFMLKIVLELNLLKK